MKKSTSPERTRTARIAPLQTAVRRSSQHPQRQRLRLLLLALGPADIARGRWQLGAKSAVELLIATSLDEALALLGAEWVDGIVCPVLLNELGAAALIKKLTRAQPETPIVVIAQAAGDPAIKRALKAGAEDFVVSDHADPTLLLKTVRQSIERRHTAAQLEYLSRHDKLTGLANRELFADRLQVALDRSARGGRAVAVIRVDIDHFRAINDSLGHGGGDAVLVTVARRLQQCLRNVDTIARTGNDEFSVLLEDVEQADDLDRVCRKIQEINCDPLAVLDGHVGVTFSIGVALSPDDGENSRDLSCSADTALEHARSAGRDRYVRYGAPESDPVSVELRLKRQFDDALASGQFNLDYQPRVNIQTGRVLGFEALIRWQHPEYDTLLPERFIPLAEQCGFIVPLGTWVLEQACRDLQALATFGYGDLGVAVNLSALQFLRGDLIETVAELITRYEVDPNLLIFEITETTLMEDTALSVQQLDTLKAMGVAVYLDDFGTGYSSLAYLKRFKLDGLKIDRDFIRDIPHDSEDVAISRAIIALSQALQMGVIAEGVETTAQLAFVQAEGCDEAQGFLFSEALSLQALVGWLKVNSCGAAHPLLQR